jgi:hypothetical protein
MTTTTETVTQAQIVDEASQWLIDVRLGLNPVRVHRNGKFWRADESELFPSCPRPASWKHICSAKHAAEKFGVPATAIRQRVKSLNHQRDTQLGTVPTAPVVGAAHQETKQQ